MILNLPNVIANSTWQGQLKYGKPKNGINQNILHIKYGKIEQ